MKKSNFTACSKRQQTIFVTGLVERKMKHLKKCIPKYGSLQLLSTFATKENGLTMPVFNRGTHYMMFVK